MILDLTHLQRPDLAALGVALPASRRGADALAVHSGLHGARVLRADDGAGRFWVAAATNEQHATFLADGDTQITLPIAARDGEPYPLAQWRQGHAHGSCRTCDWWNGEPRRLTDSAFQVRIGPLMAYSRPGQNYARAVHDKLATVLRLRSEGRHHEAVYFLTRAERFAARNPITGVTA